MNVLKRKSECRAVSPDLWDYVGERLPENALERVENHLVACVACQNEVEGMRRAQNLLRDCRSQVPAPRSDWYDLQVRMRAEGMISPLSGRILTQGTSGQVESARTPRRSSLALDWNRLSLAGSVATTLLLSISIYRLTTPPIQDFLSNEAAVPTFSTRPNTRITHESNTESNASIVFGDPFPAFITPVNATTQPESTPRRNTEMAPRSVVQNRQSENLGTQIETASPIVWTKPQRPQSPAPPQKYSARSLPIEATKAADNATAFVPSALNMSQNAQGAKTRYMMQHLMPVPFTEEGIY